MAAGMPRVSVALAKIGSENREVEEAGGEEAVDRGGQQGGRKRGVLSHKHSYRPVRMMETCRCP